MTGGLTMPEPRMRVTASVPSLTNKIKLDITGSADVIHWYIRFNIPLDETTVNDQTMEVTDTDGYIMRTDISYQAEQNRICISPLDTYEENRYYLLNISKKVCSARGQPLRTRIHILFKLYKAQVSEYKVLRQDVNTPRPKPRPADYDLRQAYRKPNALDIQYGDGGNLPTDRMTTVAIRINMWIGLMGLVLVLLGFALQLLWLVALAAGVCVIGATHIGMQLRNRVIAGKILYNKGVRLYNKAQYFEAREAFEKSYRTDPGNDIAKYGIFKLEKIK
jgi:hypothetical protein